MNPQSPEEFPNDGLDPLLRAWHEENRAHAHAARGRVLAAAEGGARPAALAARRWLRGGLASAAIIALAVTAAILFPVRQGTAVAAGGMAMLPDGGRLEAFDARGCLVGPCALTHTDVRAQISGPFTRVTLVQRFENPYSTAIEAVYTFPLSDRGAVDRMRMTVRDASGERIVDGVVKERSLARAIYESARAAGFVASLLEQERPNIFTQSVANIAPGAKVDVEISYIETLSARDGVYEFAFPMTVGPRYIPGAPSSAPALPAGVAARTGVVLLGPAQVAFTDEQLKALAALPSAAALPANAPALLQALGAALPVDAPRRAGEEPASVGFTATYADGSSEPGELFADGTGQVGGRWFLLVARQPKGTGASPDTAQVPDASRITPMPTRPPVRAGHDISVSVDLDAGGAPVAEAVSVQHGVDVQWNGASRARFALRGGKEIPNRDFVLRWSLKGSQILEGTFAGVRTAPGQAGIAGRPDGFVTLVLNPPARVEPVQVLPRELVFVIDTSGSMNGFPIEKSKELMRLALAQMRAGDTFNLVTFAGDTKILWPELRPATPANLEEARRWIDGARSGGGTEMMKAIEAALVQMPMSPQTAPPAGGQSVPPNTPVRPAPTGGDAARAGGEDFVPATAPAAAPAAAPMRLAVFLTDGFVGIDQGIIDAVAKHAGTTRVFTLGIGTSVNRYLLEEMALRGRGACDIVLLADDADAAVKRLTRRMQTPLLADITVTAEGVELEETLPSGALLPDLFDAQPMVLHARYHAGGTGAIVVRGRTGAGPYERRIPLTLPVAPLAGDASGLLPQLWARAKVDAVLAPHLAQVEQQTLPLDLKAQVIALGEQFQIMTPYTSFVAVERTKVVSNGRPMLVTIPVELPEGTRFDGFFGDRWANEPIAYAVSCAMGADTGREGGTGGNATDLLLDETRAKGKQVVVGDIPALAPQREESEKLGRDVAMRSRKGEAAAVDSLALSRPGTGGVTGGGGFGGGGPGGGATPGNAGDGRVRRMASGGRDALKQSDPAATGAPLYGGVRGSTNAPAIGNAATPSAGAPAAPAAPAPPPPPAPPAYKANEAQPQPSPSAAPTPASAVVPDADVSSGAAAAAAPGAKSLPPAAEAKSLPPAKTAVLAEEARNRLARVLERRLLALALFGRLNDAERAKLPPLHAELASLLVDGAVHVAISARPESLERLRALGVQVETQKTLADGGLLLVARIPLRALAEAAQLDGVRRIEPIEAVDAAEAVPAAQ